VKRCTIKKKPKHPKKRWGNTRNQMERPTSKKTKEPPKEGKPQGEHQVPNNGLEPIVKGGGGAKK